MSVVVKDLPLLDLFTRLREAGLPLGIGEYEWLLCALQAGFGLPNDPLAVPAGGRAALKQLCKTLWVKSLDDAALFDYHFEKVMASPASGASLFEMPSSAPQPTKAAAPVDETDSPIAEPEESPAEVSEGEANEAESREAESRKAEAAPSPLTSPATTSPDSTFKMGEDEIQTTLAVLETTSRDDSIWKARFIMSSDYFPVTQRQMKQSWRHLRRQIRAGAATELDIDATVREVGRQGVLVEPILVPRRINRAELLLLIDQNGSMIPFHPLSRRLVKTAQRGGRLGWATVYYFHNCPVDVLYRDPYHSAKQTLSDVLQQLHTKQAAALIFSDAGAARGGFNEERLKLTNQFLIQLSGRIRSIAWLNPVPSDRWAGTTAGQIAHSVPMFYINRQGLHQAIDVLRGSETLMAR